MLANAIAILRGVLKRKRNFDTWMCAARRTGRLGVVIKIGYF